MSSVITRAYMRGRLIIIMIGFVLAVGAGSAVILWQAESAKTSVKFGAVVAFMAEAASDVLYHALKLEQARPVVGPEIPAAIGAPGSTMPAPACTTPWNGWKPPTRE